MNRIVVALVVALLLGVGIWAGLHDWRDPDLDSEGFFARVAAIKHGKAWVRSGEAADPEATEDEVNRHSAIALKQQDGVPPGARVDVEANSELRLETTGGWTLLLKEGRYHLLDSRKEDNPGRRWVKVRVAHGSLRAKAHDHHPDEQWLEVELASAHVELKEGQIGMRVLPEGGGQVWLINGEATLERDGKDSLGMEPKKVEEL